MYSGTIVRNNSNIRFKSSSLFDYLELFLIVLVLYSYPGLINSYKQYLIDILLLFELFALLSKRNNFVFLKRTIPLLVVVLFSGLIQIITNKDHSRAFEYMIAFSSFLMAASRISNSQNKVVSLINLLRIMSYVTIAGTILSLVWRPFFSTILPFLYGNASDIDEFAKNGVYVGFFSEPSFNAYALMIGFIIFGTDFAFGRKKVTSIIFMLLCFFGVVLSSKRSFFLILFVLALAIILLSNYRKRYISLMMLFLGVLAMIIFALVNPNPFEFMTRMFNDNNLINLNYRDIIWDIALTQFKKHPLFGIGINQFDIYFNEFYLANFPYYEYRYFAGAHNSYIQLLSELGIFSLLFFITFFAFFYFSIRATRRCDGKDKHICIISVTIQLLTLTYALTGNPIHQYQQLLMYILSLGIIFPYFSRSVGELKEV